MWCAVAVGNPVQDRGGVEGMATDWVNQRSKKEWPMKKPQSKKKTSGSRSASAKASRLATPPAQPEALSAPPSPPAMPEATCDMTPSPVSPRVNGTQTAPPSRPPSVPSREHIAARAYALYAARGYRDGHAMEDWLEAEREIVVGASS